MILIGGKTKVINENWYVLYGGSSVDGRGNGEFIGRTADEKVALEHYAKCREDPYGTGYVLVITDNSAKRMFLP